MNELKQKTMLELKKIFEYEGNAYSVSTTSNAHFNQFNY